MSPAVTTRGHSAVLLLDERNSVGELEASDHLRAAVAAAVEHNDRLAAIGRIALVCQSCQYLSKSLTTVAGGDHDREPRRFRADPRGSSLSIREAPAFRRREGRSAAPGPPRAPEFPRANR